MISMRYGHAHEEEYYREQMSRSGTEVMILAVRHVASVTGMPGSA
jgi:hypothetical protein